MRKFILLTLMAAGVVCNAATGDEQAVRRMTERLIPEHAAKFSFEQTSSPEDSYEIETRRGRVKIRGNSANSMAVGLNRYLNDYCLTQVSWYADQAVDMPAELPMLPEKVAGKARVENRFFLNYCTFGYTMPWWKWTDWERLIDWMALNGVNMPLAITGQEAVWYRVWTNMGLTDSEVRSYFTGPAHLPWHRMSNIDYWQGPLPMEWLDGQEKLQKQIVARERELGMKPILPAFAGHVPKELLRLHPEAKIKSLGSWGGFDEKYMSHYLDPLDPLYAEIQRAFLEEQTRLFGTDHIYGADPFNEVRPPSLEPEYLASCSRETYRSMAAVDPEAVWLQMSWMFSYESHMWTPERVKAFLEAVPQGKMMLLDYYCEKTEVWRMTEKFYGQPYLWCYLGNFGGNVGLAGNTREAGARFENALVSGGENLAGIGSTLEGFDVNPFIYEYIFSKAWDGGLSDVEWINRLADRHLGASDADMRRAWRVLYDSVYVTPAGLGGGTLLNARPVLTGNGKWAFSNIAYQNKTLFEAWEAMLSVGAAHTRAEYEYDVVNVGRQVLGNHFTVLRDQFAEAYMRGDVAVLREKGFAMNELLADLDALLSTQSSFLLGKWLADARAMGDEKDYYEENARNIITTWGDRGISLNDYANRTWGGLVKGYYAPRWAEFIDRVTAAAAAREPFNAAAFRDWSTQFEIDWVKAHDTYPARPVGNSVEIATALMERYRTGIM